MKNTPIVGRIAFLSSDVENLGIREVTVKSVNDGVSVTKVEVNEETGHFVWGSDLFKTRAQAEAVLRDLIAAFDRQADRLRKHLAAPDMPYSKDYKLLDDAREGMMECRVWLNGAPEKANDMIENTIRALSKRLDTDYEPPVAPKPNNDLGYSIADDSLLIAGTKVVSKPGATLKVTQIKLTPRGKKMLQVQRDVHIPGVKSKKKAA